MHDNLAAVKSRIKYGESRNKFRSVSAVSTVVGKYYPRNLLHLFPSSEAHLVFEGMTRLSVETYAKSRMQIIL